MPARPLNQSFDDDLHREDYWLRVRCAWRCGAPCRAASRPPAEEARLSQSWSVDDELRSTFTAEACDNQSVSQQAAFFLQGKQPKAAPPNVYTNVSNVPNIMKVPNHHVMNTTEQMWLAHRAHQHIDLEPERNLGAPNELWALQSSFGPRRADVILSLRNRTPSSEWPRLATWQSACPTSPRRTDVILSTLKNRTPSDGWLVTGHLAVSESDKPAAQTSQ